MRTYYLFDIKDNILKNYKHNYDELYEILESVYKLKEEDLVLGYDIFEKIVNPMKKDIVNNYIKEKNIENENYICYNYTHIINDFYNDESTKMIINNSNIKIKSNKNAPSFFYNIRKFNNIFVCDFNNKDYFLLEETVYNSCVSV